MKQHPIYPWLFVTEDGKVYSKARVKIIQLTMFHEKVKIKISHGKTVCRRIAPLVWETFVGLYDRKEFEIRALGSINLKNLTKVRIFTTAHEMLDNCPWIRTNVNLIVTLREDGITTHIYYSLKEFLSDNNFSRRLIYRLRTIWGNDIPQCEKLNPLKKEIIISLPTQPWEDEEN